MLLIFSAKTLSEFEYQKLKIKKHFMYNTYSINFDAVYWNRFSECNFWQDKLGLYDALNLPFCTQLLFSVKPLLILIKSLSLWEHIMHKKQLYFKKSYRE